VKFELPPFPSLVLLLSLSCSAYKSLVVAASTSICFFITSSMALDLNKSPPHHEVLLPDLSKPFDDECLPDLNEPDDDEEFLQQVHDLDGPEFAGGHQQLIKPGNSS
jgi:hypothetical protein